MNVLYLFKINIFRKQNTLFYCNKNNSNSCILTYTFGMRNRCIHQQPIYIIFNLSFVSSTLVTLKYPGPCRTMKGGPRESHLYVEIKLYAFHSVIVSYVYV